MARRALMLREGKAPVRDRLLTMLFLAALLHGLIILGLTFNASAGPPSSAPGLEVLLVSDELPEADKNPTRHLSRAAHPARLGQHARVRGAPQPRRRVPVLRHAGTAKGDSLRDSGDMAGSPDERVLTTTAWNTQVRYLADTGSERRHQGPAAAPRCTAERRSPGPRTRPAPPSCEGPQRDELWVTPDTRAATLAPYLDSWRRKVERIGTLNYPTAAQGRRR